MRPVLLFFFVLSGLFLNAQTDKKNPVTDTTSLSVQPDLIRQSQKTVATDDETIKTPEEQGYTKTIENGKTVYRKEEGQLKLEYVPN